MLSLIYFFNRKFSPSFFTDISRSVWSELLLEHKEEQLNSVIAELRMNCTSLQEKLIKEQSEKLVREILQSLLDFLSSLAIYLFFQMNVVNYAIFITILLIKRQQWILYWKKKMQGLVLRGRRILCLRTLKELSESSKVQMRR